MIPQNELPACTLVRLSHVILSFEGLKDFLLLLLSVYVSCLMKCKSRLTWSICCWWGWCWWHWVECWFVFIFTIITAVVVTVHFRFDWLYVTKDWLFFTITHAALACKFSIVGLGRVWLNFNMKVNLKHIKYLDLKKQLFHLWMIKTKKQSYHL